MNRIIAAAKEYIRRGWAVIPLKGKRPTIKGWPQLRIKENEVEQYFGEDNNIGVLMGEPSGGLVDIDVDQPPANLIAKYFLLQTIVFGRKGKPHSHWIYKSKNGENITWALPPELRREGDKGVIVEIRAKNVATTFPPSIHPETGEPIVWEKEGEPTEVSFETLKKACARLAAAILLARVWPPQGQRQETALALAGALLEAGWSEEEARNFLHIVITIAPTEDHSQSEIAQRVRTVMSTLKKLREGGRIISWGRLAELLGGEKGRLVVRQLKEWFGIAPGEIKVVTSLPETQDEVIEEDTKSAFLGCWREYVRSLSPDLPIPFADMTGLLWAGVVAGHKVMLSDLPGSRARHPIFWVLFIGPPFSMKSQARDYLIDALPEVAIQQKGMEIITSPLHLPLSLSSVEGVYEQLTLLSNRSILLWTDEFDPLLSSQYQKDYTAKWRSFLLEHYQPHFTEVRSLKGKVMKVTDMTIYFLSSTTPENLARLGGEREIRTGFLTRFLPIWVGNVKREHFVTLSEVGEQWRKFFLELADDLSNQTIHCANPPSEPTREISFSQYKLSEEAMVFWIEKNGEFQEMLQREEELTARWLARSWEFVPRAALLLAYVQHQSSQIVFKEEIEEAYRIWKSYISPSIRRCVQFLISSKEYAKLSEIIKWIIKEKKGVATRREIVRKFRLTSFEIDILRQMGEDMDILITQDGRAPKGSGRPKEIWRVIDLPNEF
jgi:hypothetical protein